MRVALAGVRGAVRCTVWYSLLVVWGSVLSANAQERIEFGGHVKSQSTFSFYETRSETRSEAGLEDDDREYRQDVNARVISAAELGGFSFEVHGELYGTVSAASQQSVFAVVPRPGELIACIPEDEQRVFDLTAITPRDRDTIAAARLDRAYAAYTAGAVAATIGRQAISWGNGLVFQVLDPFNPFSPVAIDRDYKVGDDMAYFQYLFTSGHDLQLLAVGRRSEEGALTTKAASYAAKYRGFFLEGLSSYELLLAQHYQDALVGVGLSHTIGEAVARLDARLTREYGGELFYSAVANIDRSWIVHGTNVYGFFEYMFGGDGTAQEDYLQPSTSLQERLARGERFTLGKHYAAVGLRVECSPLLNLYVNEILNVQDQSGYAQIRVDYDVRENVLLQGGVNTPHGPRGSEFGGLRVPGDEFLRPAVVGYLRAAWYF